MKKNCVNNKFKLIVSSLMSLGIFSQMTVLGFDGDTHEYVTKNAIENIRSMSLSSENGDTTSSSEKNLSDFYDDTAYKILMEYCTKPDEDECDGFYQNHFYNIATDKNFTGEGISALDKFTIHYNNALNEYRYTNMKKCWEELGRAIHFLEDMCTPVHSSYDCSMDAVRKLSWHVGFEKRCIEIQNKCTANVNKKELEYYAQNSISQIAKVCSRIANDGAFSLDKSYDEVDEIASGCIVNAIKSIMGILYKFSLECSKLA